MNAITLSRYVCLTFVLCAAMSAHAFELNGVVQGPDEQPAEGAAVWLSQDRVVRSARTGTDGSYAFQDVQAGSVLLAAFKEGSAVGGYEGVVTGPETIAIRLSRPGRARLRILDEDGQPVAGARAGFLFVNGRYHVPVEDLVDHGFPSLRSDEQGMLEIPHLPSGGYAGAFVTHRNYAAQYVPVVPVGVDGMPVRLLPGIPLLGRAVGPDGTAVARARVFVLFPGESGNQLVRETLTGADGFYSVRLPRPRDGLVGLYVAASHPKHASPAPSPVALSRTDDECVCDIDFLEPYPLQGTLQEPGGAPAAGVHVGLFMQGFMRGEATTGHQGRFALRAPRGHGRLHADSAPGLMLSDPAGRPVTLPQDAGKDLELRLVRIPRLDGEAVFAEEGPLPNTLVHVIPGFAGGWAISDGEGRFALQPKWVAPDGTVRLAAEHAKRFLGAGPQPFPIGKGDVEIRVSDYRPDVRPCIPENAPNDLSALTGKPAPEWRAETWFGGQDGAVELGALKGRVVVLTLLDLSEPLDPGRERIAQLNAAAALYEQDDKVRVIAIQAAATPPAVIEQAMQDFDIRFPVGLDGFGAPTFDVYDVTVVPQTVLIDGRGVLRFYEVGGRLFQLIKALRREV